jgi:hypothetical protein
MYRTAATHVTRVRIAEITTINQCHISLHLLNPFPFTCKTFKFHIPTKEPIISSLKHQNNLKWVGHKSWILETKLLLSAEQCRIRFLASVEGRRLTFSKISASIEDDILHVRGRGTLSVRCLFSSSYKITGVCFKSKMPLVLYAR